MQNTGLIIHNRLSWSPTVNKNCLKSFLSWLICFLPFCEITRMYLSIVVVPLNSSDNQVLTYRKGNETFVWLSVNTQYNKRLHKYIHDNSNTNVKP